MTFMGIFLAVIITMLLLSAIGLLIFTIITDTDIKEDYNRLYKYRLEISICIPIILLVIALIITLTIN